MKKYPILVLDNCFTDDRRETHRVRVVVQSDEFLAVEVADGMDALGVERWREVVRDDGSVKDDEIYHRAFVMLAHKYLDTLALSSKAHADLADALAELSDLGKKMLREV